MEDVLKGGSGAVFLFLYLFPGFLGSAAYDFFVESRKRDNFDRIVAALVLALLTSMALKFFAGMPLLPVVVDEKTPVSSVVDAFFGKKLFWQSVLSISTAVFFAWLNNKGKIFDFLRQFGITNKESSVDVWADVFGRLRGFWVKITFKDGTLLFGWPRFYSQFGDPRELFIENATWWRRDESGDMVSSDVVGPGVYIADFSAVASIELLN